MESPGNHSLGMEAWGRMTLARRAFLKWGGLSLVGAKLAPRLLFSSPGPKTAASFPLRDQLFNEEFPFPYDENYFRCAERVYNVRTIKGREPGCQANLSLVFKLGKKLDVKVLVSEKLEGLSTSKDVFAFYGVEDSLDIDIAGGEGPRVYYQVLYREGGGNWKALSPKSFKQPGVGLENGGKVTVIFIADDHTFDDADFFVPDAFKETKLSGDYVNELLKAIRFNPAWLISNTLRALKGGFCLAHTLRYIMANEDPDFIINLGDTTGISAAYRWKNLGLPTEGLTDKDFDYISYTLWLRMRKLYSALTPHMPMFIAQGNHDGEEQWSPAKFFACQWRKKLFPMPDDLTYPEGGHPEGKYYAFSWGGNRADRGGVRFIVLHTTAFTGEDYPKTPEGWTLGETQQQWFERVVQMGKKDWVFACFHHVLGGWPAGPEESIKDIAYGRGPLFTPADYYGYADPGRVEQVKLTELGQENGLRAFFYGHDHIFHAKKISTNPEHKETLGICCGSPKYIGEIGWWNGNFWRKHYGSGFAPAQRFWGPPGITKLTVKKDEATIEYLATAYTAYSNHPEQANIGSVLETLRLGNPPPELWLEKKELTFQAFEGQKGPPPQVFRVKNRGSGVLRYQLKVNQPWIFLSQEYGESWGERDEIKAFVQTRNLEEGAYEGKITVETTDAANSPQEIRVCLTLKPPFIYAPRNFRGQKKENAILLTWGPHPLNRNIRRYRIYSLDEKGGTKLLAEVSGKTWRYLVRNVDRTKPYRFALSAVDDKNREGEKAYLVVA